MDFAMDFRIGKEEINPVIWMFFHRMMTHNDWSDAGPMNCGSISCGATSLGGPGKLSISPTLARVQCSEILNKQRTNF